MTLDLDAIHHGTDKSSLVHDYCRHYERHLGTPQSILEIGVATGASLRMWEEFYPQARVMGVDQNLDTVTGRVTETHQGDATDPATYRGWLPNPVGVVVDDGSHQGPEVTATFALLWPFVAPGGWYVIEDLACIFRGEDFGSDAGGGPVTALLTDLAHQAIRGSVELHVYWEIAFIAKRPARHG